MKELEERLKEYLNVKYLVLTDSGTGALLAAYWALRKNYKTLAVDPYTFPATYKPADILGYNINFIRTILNANANIPKNELKAIVHLFGQPNGLVLDDKENTIEDACQSFGADILGKKVGTIGKIGCYSFYPTKSLHTCGNGGAVVTNNEELYWEMKTFIECGRKNGQMTEVLALNLRMDEVKAEFLLDEFKEYESRIEIQRSIAQELMSVIPGEQPFLSENKGQRHIYSVFNMLIDERDKFRKYMSEKLIDTIVYYGPDMLPTNERDKYTDITSRVIAIPCRWSLKQPEIRKIKVALREWFT